MEKIIWIKQATKKGYIACKNGGVFDCSYPTSKLRRGRVQEGGNVSPTLTCESGGIVRIEIMENGFFQQALETAERENAKPGDIVDAFNGRVHKDGISPTITTRPEGKKTAVLPVVEDKRNMIEDVKENEPKQEVDPNLPKYAIRKLTPRECFRLMNFSDEDFEKAQSVNSNSQLFKQAGNSIVRAVLIAIFSQLGIQNHKRWNEMSLEERRALVYKGTILENK